VDYYYISHGIIIYPHRHVIEQQGKITHVRPKTFALLLALLEKPKQIVTKDFLLTHIWDDVAVDEQVLAQSIREIRQLFGNSDVIKTYPRKGYSWIFEVEKRPAKIESVSTDFLEKPALAKKISPRSGYIIGLLTIVAFSIALFSFIKPLKASFSATPLDGTLIVLPVKTRIAGNDHQWIYLGAMDQIIHLLASKQVVVMDTIYVLNAMRHASMPRDYTNEQVQRIFAVSGAGLVVETELSGSVAEYRLDYKLHFKHGTKRGVVFGHNLNKVLIQLAEIVSPYTGGKLSRTETNHQSEFNSELMVRALEYMDQGANNKARDLLVSVISLEEHNLLARQLLSQVLIQIDEPAQAEHELMVATADQQAEPQELARLYYWLAMAQSRQGQMEKAFTSLQLADKLAGDQGDWLYRAYIAELRGQIFNRVGQINEAEIALKEALKYHGVIQCPIGEVQTQLQLASLFRQQGREREAMNYITLTKNLIETHQLDNLKPLLEPYLVTAASTN
jgi:DNA-binding winged helix-turn-helix (wHTH) protein/tetratricopeptide (TPR) repeat protein